MLAYKNGWEVIVLSDQNNVILRSAFHSSEAIISKAPKGEYQIACDVILDRDEIFRLSYTRESLALN